MRMRIPVIRKLSLPGLDFLGLRRDALVFFTRIQRERGDLARFRVPGRRLVLLGNPDHVRDLLLTHASKVEKGPALRSTRVLLGDGLLTSEGSVHLEHRRWIQPAFHRSELLRYVPGMLVETAGLEEADVGHIRVRDRITFVGVKQEHDDRPFRRRTHAP